jgi:hypothetical protein
VKTKQYELALIPHAYKGEVIQQRQANGYINATAMCKAAGKAWADYYRLNSTKAFLAELSAEVGKPISELVQVIKGGDPTLQGSWVHPQVAINLAQWASPKFAVQVSEWVIDWMSGMSPTDRAWKQFEDRVSLVYDNVPEGYFCVFKESADIVAALIMNGARPGTRMLLDISIGQCWARHWREQELAQRYGEHRYFDHHYPSYFPQALSNPQSAACYPEEALPEFRRWMREVYVPTKLPAYLTSQVRQQKLPAPFATNAITALAQRERSRALPRREK